MSDLTEEILKIASRANNAYTEAYQRGYDMGYMAGVAAAQKIFDKHFPPKDPQL